jgi:8-oxo-dGTP pyrophosphatase MutT (NUDIX family)
MVPPALPASTVILLRDRESPPPGLETFLLRRRASGAFAGAHVFPGGRVDLADRDPRWRGVCAGLGQLEQRVADHLSADLLLGHAVAAVREVFEETGVLLGTPTRPLARAVLQAGRHALLADNARFFDWCVEQGVRLSLGALRPWAHWITPEAEDRRFDTWFFLAAAPHEHGATVLVGEALEGEWIAPGAALAAGARGEVLLAPPTLRTLEEVEQFATIEPVLEASRDRPLTPVMPRLLERAEWPTLVLPTDPEYGVDAQLGVRGPTRFVRRGSRWVSTEAPAARH